MSTVLNPVWTAQHNQVTGPAFIAGLAGTNSTTATQYFVDQYGHPRLWVATETWCLPCRAGEWTTPAGNYQSDYDTFFSERAAQGVTVTMTDPFESAADTFTAAPYQNGNTWDNVSPWVNGTDAGGGLNSTFWTRIDYMMNSALSSGITIGFTLNTYHDGYQAAGTPFAGWTTTQFQAYGAAVGARYASQLNVVWLFGNDSLPGSPSPGNPDDIWSAFLTGLTGAGATQLHIAWWQAEYTSRYALDPVSSCGWGISHSQANFVYTYNASYYAIEFAYGEVANQGAANLLPVLWGDGFWFQGESIYDSTQDRSWRQEIWWALASGALGILTESNNVFSWASAAALAAVTTDWGFVHSLPHITSYFQGLPEWWNLIPDLSSALVTGGRGTRVGPEVSGGSGSQYENSFANSYVAASITPDGKLAVLYLPNHTTVTVTTSLLASGWTATWVDPISAATSSAGTGTSYSSTAKGTNSQGDPDWVLVFEAP